ncbi:GYL1 Probable GTPase-activating protein GYL1 [Candida maltosa Xu316]
MDAVSPSSPTNGVDFEKKLPEIPHANGRGQITFDLNDKVSQIAAVRQFELYSSIQSNENSDLFVNNPNGDIIVKKKLNEIEVENAETKYWVLIIEDYSNRILKDKDTESLEQEILKGIPVELRYLVYLRMLYIRQKLNSKETFEGLLVKARQIRDEYIENLTVDIKAREILMVLNYYINQVSNGNGEIESSENDEDKDELIQVPVSRFIINVCGLLITLPDVSQEEVFYLILKLNRLYTTLNKDEFFYKISRSLEVELFDIFKHISVQGINLNTLFRNIIVQFFNSELLDQKMCLTTLDFVVFEGFDFILRMMLVLFASNKDKILELDGDDLLRFINSPEFFTGVQIDFNNVLAQEPHIIQYENEFYLINANSLSNNSNELTNLKEINDELVIKINDLRRKIESLEVTHREISSQSEQYTTDLSSAEVKNQNLVQTQSELQEKYKHLTMADNLSNTIKANEEFSQRNAELEQQIEALKKSIDAKKVKLGKVSSK